MVSTGPWEGWDQGSQEPEVATVAITNKRGSGKSWTLSWAGWREKSLGFPVSSNMKGMAWWTDHHCRDPTELFNQPGCILGDEFYVAADPRASMTWDVRIVGYLIAQGRKHGEGAWPNHTYVCLPWNLERLRAVDIRIAPFFDWEWQPVYYKKEDMIVVYRNKIEDDRRTKFDPFIIPYPRARGYSSLFDTYEKLLPKKMEERMHQVPVTQTVLMK